ncbi:MAG: hypothetical protein DME25_18020 [Verrucomicrobia bacterium]|nr:MAG: hypothetical protein DME25_18020 [Verrucomicrobiota bacterium]
MKRLFCIAPLFPAMAFAGMQKCVTLLPLDAAAIPAAVKPLVEGKPWLGKERGPVEGLMLFAQEKSGAVWLGGESGRGPLRSQSGPALGTLAVFLRTPLAAGQFGAEYPGGRNRADAPSLDSNENGCVPPGMATDDPGGESRFLR